MPATPQAAPRPALALLATAAMLAAPLAAQPAALYAPIDLEVVDVEATVAVAAKAGEHLPLVLMHDPAIALEVGDGFDATFARTREAFLARLQAAFGTATLDAAAVGEPPFREFRADFQEDNTLFPVSPALAQSWARGFDGEPVRERISGLLRAFERDQLIGEIRPASSVFVVAPGVDDGARTWGEVAPRARVVEPQRVLTPPAAADLLRRMNDPLDRAAGGYLSGLLRPNVREDIHLTGLLLRERLGSAAVQRTILRGARLAESGQPVDPWAALALAQLARLGLEPLTAAPEPVIGSSPERPGVGVESVDTGVSGEDSRTGVRVLVFGVVFVFLGGAVALAWVVWRRGRSEALQVAGGAAPAGAGEAMIPHLARDLKDRLVRALFTQRSVLLANEQAASRRVQEMEERLARLQPAIAEKIRGYERRIEALEKEITERDAETRDLLRAKLVLARKELDAEISRNRLDWN